MLSYQTVDFADGASFDNLGKEITALEKERKLKGNRLFYLAIAPSFFAPVIKQLSEHKLIHRYRPGKPWYRVVIEKPFGRDLASAGRWMPIFICVCTKIRSIGSTITWGKKRC